MFLTHSSNMKNIHPMKGVRASFSPFARRIVRRKMCEFKPSSTQLGSTYQDNHYANIVSSSILLFCPFFFSRNISILRHWCFCLMSSIQNKQWLVLPNYSHWPCKSNFDGIRFSKYEKTGQSHNIFQSCVKFPQTTTEVGDSILQ